MELRGDIKKAILTAQKNEITEHLIYFKLSKSIKDPNNKKVLKDISNDELRHYHFWKNITNKDVKPNRFKVWRYYLISRLLGVTFGIKLMEKGEEGAQITYADIAKVIPEAQDIVEDEDAHERELINMIDEERLKYVGSMVLGLNDALVELTGALAGFTLALQNTRLIAMTGLVTGIAASLSMGASEYLSTKSEEGSEGDKSPIKASLYTGSAYVITVFFLIFPFLVFSNVYFCLGFTMFNAMLVILVFTFYIAIAKDVPFRSRFFEMAGISLGVAILSFFIGYLIRIFLNVEI